MSSCNRSVIRQAFARQAAGFESSRMNFSRKDYLDDIVAKIELSPAYCVLEAAAGTCACGRAMAPFVQSVTCLDLTPAMLAVGKAAAEKAGIRNMAFTVGDVAALPFADSSYNVVFSRLALHHFPDPTRPFAEMVRVLKPGGKLVLIDMEAAPAPLRETEDSIERLRDPSHVRSLSTAEMQALYVQSGLTLTRCETSCVPVNLQSWLDLTHTPPAARERITQMLTDELRGGAKTGLAPYYDGTQLYFDQKWVFLIGTKS